jgi:hypothetical protein
LTSNLKLDIFTKLYIVVAIFCTSLFTIFCALLIAGYMETARCCFALLAPSLQLQTGAIFYYKWVVNE